MNRSNKGLIFIVMVSAPIFVGVATYGAGYKSASLKYEAAMNKQHAQFNTQKQVLETQLYTAEQAAIRQINDVQTVYVPIEKEIINYVSTPKSDRSESDINEWVQLHNAAANPYTHQTARGLDDATAIDPGAD